jgi:hypothetical protein
VHTDPTIEEIQELGPQPLSARNIVGKDYLPVNESPLLLMSKVVGILCLQLSMLQVSGAFILYLTVFSKVIIDHAIRKEFGKLR